MPNICTEAPAYDATGLISHPRIWAALSQEATDLLGVHSLAPDVVHYLADLRRWILVQMAMALHFEQKTDPRSPPLTPRKLHAALGDSGIASRNTVRSFLHEIARLELTELPPAGKQRQHAIEVSAKSERLIGLYIDIHLRALDTLDGAGRSRFLGETPTLLPVLQPGFARRICLTPAWHTPPEAIKCFTNSVSGSSILHELVLSTQAIDPDQDDRYLVNLAPAGELAARYHVSTAHISRLLSKAQGLGSIGWQRKARRGACWLSAQLRDSYLLWQAEKLAALSHAYRHAGDAVR